MNDDCYKKFGKKVKIEVGKDLLDAYEIQKEVKEISTILDRIRVKSNSTCVKDLLKDMYETYDNLSDMK